MAALKHFFKSDVTERSTTSTGDNEVSNYTVTWADLTGAGFANGDDVIVLIKFNYGGNSAATNMTARFKQGSTFAGAANLTQLYRVEPDNATSGLGAREFLFLDRVTLATNDNFYLGIGTTSIEAARIEDWCFVILKLGDLAADDFRYAEAGSNAVTASPQDGASVTLPSGGGDDWLVFGAVDWDVDSTTNDHRLRLSLNGATSMEAQLEGEDAAEILGIGAIGYYPAAASSAVCKLTYDATSGTSAGTHLRSAIFALRMEAFADHAGNQDADAVAMGGVVDTYVETNTVSLSLSAAGPVAFFASTIADITDTNHEPYHRVQVDGADIVSGLGRRGHAAYIGTDQLPLSSFGIASMSSGTRVIDVDSAEDRTATAYNFDEHALVVFSLELAGGEPPGGTILPQMMQHGLFLGMRT